MISEGQIDNESKFEIRRGLWDNRPRVLQINRNFIEFEDKDLINNSSTRFAGDSITGYKFGIKWIRGFEFTIGREFQIYIRSSDNKELKIFFKSFYGIKKQELTNVYGNIIEELWNCYFGDLANKYLVEFRKGSEIQIENVVINDIGIQLSCKIVIPWNKVGTKDYQTYFSIFSMEDPAKLNKSYSYMKDWNTAIIYSVVRTILRDKSNFGS